MIARSGGRFGAALRSAHGTRRPSEDPPGPMNEMFLLRTERALRYASIASTEPALRGTCVATDEVGEPVAANTWGCNGGE